MSDLFRLNGQLQTAKLKMGHVKKQLCHRESMKVDHLSNLANDLYRVVDGFEGSTSTLAGAGAPYELVKKVALTNHFIATRWLFMAQDVYESIPEKWRDILDECALEFGMWEQTSCADDEAVQIQKMKDEAGVTWNEVDIDAFTEACAPVYDWIVEEYGANPDLHQQLVDLINDFRASK